MKRSLFTAAAPILAVGLAFSIQGEPASAASSTPAAQTATHSLQAVQKQISTIDSKFEDIHADLARDKVISEETRVLSLSRLNSLLYQTNTASRQIDSVIQQIGSGTLQTTDAENKLNTTAALIVELRDALFVPGRDEPVNSNGVPEGVMDEQ